MAAAGQSASLRTAKLCSMCLNIFACWDEMKEKTRSLSGHRSFVVSDWYKDAAEYMASAGSGCVMCMRLLDGRWEGEEDEIRRLLLSGTKLVPELTITNPHWINPNWERRLKRARSDSDSEMQDEAGDHGKGRWGMDANDESESDPWEGDNESSSAPESDSESEDEADMQGTKRHGIEFFDGWNTDGGDCAIYSDSDLGMDLEASSTDTESSVGTDSPYGSFDISCEFRQIAGDGKQDKRSCDLSHKGSWACRHLSLIPISLETDPSIEVVATINAPLRDGTHSATPICKAAEIVSSALEASTGSENSLRSAKRMVENCLESHPQCRRDKSVKGPTRLVNVSMDGVRLCTPTGSEGNPQFATLSHCWGKIDMFKLRKSNIAALHNEIPVDQLCRTFQEAITVTRYLGLAYLWIDSICIIQDDAADWDHEAAMMGEIYSNGVVNIAAAGAEDGSVGLFFERDVLQESAHYVRINGTDIYKLQEQRLYERSLENTCLTARGWCFQERFLARRTLHFTKSQIFFECNCKTACESRPEGFPDSIWWTNAPERVLPKDRDHPSSWFQAVKLYSAGRLSFSKDKLIAISGVARHFHTITGDKYVAGLWRSNIERELCWRVDREEVPSASETSRPPSGPCQLFADHPLYQAPTWSWASTNEPISWELYGFTVDQLHSLKYSTTLVSVLNCPIALTGTDKFGQLQNAQLEVDCGPLIAGNVVLSYFDAYKEYFPRESSHKEDIIECLASKGPMGKIWFDHGDGSQYATEPIFFMPVVEHAPLGSMCGLILKVADSHPHGYFTRVGVWDITFKKDDYEDLMEYLLSEPGSLMDESLYENVFDSDSESEDGLQKYTLTLI